MRRTGDPEPTEIRPVGSRASAPRGRWGPLAGLGVVVVLVALPLVAHGLWGLTGSAVLTDSMLPAVGAGDLIVTRRILASELRIGQVAILDPPDGPLRAHRVTESRRAGAGAIELVTKGDANSSPDEPLRVSVGKAVPVMVMRVPGAGYVADFFTRREVLPVGLGLLLLANVLTIGSLLYPRSRRRALVRGSYQKGDV